jgi:protein TonB
MRRKIEAQGTEDFPVHNGEKLYGSLTMLIEVNSQGRVVQTQVLQSSGNAELDQQAQRIVYQAHGFGPFSPAMRAQAQALEMVTRFVFAKDSTLQTQPAAPPTKRTP